MNWSWLAISVWLAWNHGSHARSAWINFKDTREGDSKDVLLCVVNAAIFLVSASYAVMMILTHLYIGIR